jgi:carbonic anhydrase
MGLLQSPINIAGNAPRSPAMLTFSYQNSRMNVINNGHTVQVNYDPGSTLTINGKVHRLAQFHFHVPGEHLIDGVAPAMEMHLVHMADDGALAVVAVLFDIAEPDNAFLAQFWDVLPGEGREVDAGIVANVAAAFETGSPRFSYVGSLTTPPCSEGVSWYVLAERETVSREQLAEFVELLGFNARPVQPLGVRQISL